MQESHKYNGTCLHCLLPETTKQEVAEGLLEISRELDPCVAELVRPLSVLSFVSLLSLGFMPLFTEKQCVMDMAIFFPVSNFCFVAAILFAGFVFECYSFSSIQRFQIWAGKQSIGCTVKKAQSLLCGLEDKYAIICSLLLKSFLSRCRVFSDALFVSLAVSCNWSGVMAPLVICCITILFRICVFFHYYVKSIRVYVDSQKNSARADHMLFSMPGQFVAITEWVLFHRTGLGVNCGHKIGVFLPFFMFIADVAMSISKIMFLFSKKEPAAASLTIASLSISFILGVIGLWRLYQEHGFYLEYYICYYFNYFCNPERTTIVKQIYLNRLKKKLNIVKEVVDSVEDSRV